MPRLSMAPVPDGDSRNAPGAATELERAIDQYKRASGRMFPTWSEVLEVVRSLGYAKSETVFRPDEGHSSDRRREPRYEPGEASVHLGWWEGDEFRAELGTLRNVSRGGAAVRFQTELDLPESVWLCVVGPGRVNWTAARLVDRDGRIVRIQFAEPLTHELFGLLV